MTKGTRPLFVRIQANIFAPIFARLSTVETVFGGTCTATRGGVNAKYIPQYLKKWSLPSNYMGAHWPDFYVFLSRNRDSKPLENSNFDAGLLVVQSVASKESIPGDPDDMGTVQKISENHWAVGWVEWIAIHESDAAALHAADKIAERLENYPVVDDELFSQYETQEAEETWRNCYSPSERVEYIREHSSQFDFSSFADMLGCVRGKYFAGYASELLH